jgi:hypothetical protein
MEGALSQVLDKSGFDPDTDLLIILGEVEIYRH